MEDFTFRQYLKESGYDKMSYQEEVYTTCLGFGNYQNIDLYYQDEIDEGYEQNVPVNELAARLCAQFDTDYGTPKPAEIPEFEEEEYSQDTLDAFADYPQDEFNEATETEETFDDWKGYVFKYLDKRVDVDKIKELGTYIKDFVKQEWDNGEPSWFAAAESIVNYARANYPNALKDRSYATTITESLIKDDRGNVSITDLVEKIMNKAGMVVDYDDAYTAAAYYIAAFYSKQSMPINGMVMWGARDLQKFKSIYDGQIKGANSSEEIHEYEKKAVTGVRSIMLGNPGKKWRWIEEIKDEVREERKAAEEKRKQDYLNSDEYKKSQDPGWRGPRGTWTLGT